MTVPYIFNAPFLTDADMRIYFNDLHGMVYSGGGPVIFFHRDVDKVICDGNETEIIAAGENWLQVSLPEGEHDIQILVNEKVKRLDPNNIESIGVGTGKPVDNFADFNAAVKEAAPGDEIVIKNGVYTDWNVYIMTDGEEEKPVTIRAQIPGKVIFAQKSCIIIGGNHIVVKGFCFDHAYTTNNHTSALIIDRNYNHNRVTQNQFFNCGFAGNFNGNVLRLRVGASYNRIDHNFFAMSNCMSISQHQGRAGETVGKYNRIDHNIFRDMYDLWAVNGTGEATLQLAQGGIPNRFKQAMYATVEYNLFDNNHNGQVISNKSSSNLHRRNVFANSRQPLWLRSGNGAVADGNVFFCTDGGVVIATGERHAVINNLIVNAKQFGVRFWHNLSFNYEILNTLVANNTIVNAGIDAQTTHPEFRSRRTGNRILNNLFVSDSGAAGVSDTLEKSMNSPLIQSNLSLNSDNAMLEGDGADLRLPKESPATGKAVPLSEVGYDRWGTTRGGAPDIGADQTGVVHDTVYLSDIPEARGPVIEPYKGDMCIQDETEQSGIKTYGLTGDDFIMEWQIKQGACADKCTMGFSNGYSLEWEGADTRLQKGKYIIFKKNGKEISHTINTELDLREPGSQGYIEGSIDPDKWHSFRLYKNGGFIVLEQWSQRYGYSPTLAWEDTGTIEGPVLLGNEIKIEIVGDMLIRNICVWNINGIYNQ